MARTQQAELHFHALPGVDDGPATLEQSLQLLRAAEADGTTQVVATPHVRPDAVTDTAELAERVRELQAAAGRAGLAIALRTGGELDHRMVGRLTSAELDLIAQGPAGARWLLVEHPFAPTGSDFGDALTELHARGFGTVVAHPERSLTGPDERALSCGSAIQVNAQSVTGDHGPVARDGALALLARGRVAALSSDAHGRARPPLLGGARRALTATGLPDATVHALTVAGPLRLLKHGLFTERSRQGRPKDTKHGSLQANLVA